MIKWNHSYLHSIEFIHSNSGCWKSVKIQYCHSKSFNWKRTDKCVQCVQIYCRRIINCFEWVHMHNMALTNCIQCILLAFEAKKKMLSISPKIPHSGALYGISMVWNKTNETFKLHNNSFFLFSKYCIFDEIHCMRRVIQLIRKLFWYIWMVRSGNTDYVRLIHCIIYIDIDTQARVKKHWQPFLQNYVLLKIYTISIHIHIYI